MGRAVTVEQTTTLTEACEKVVQWISEGQALLDLLNRMMETHERLRVRTQSLEEEVTGLEREIASLREENSRLHRERGEVVDALNRAMAALTGPLREIVDRLGGGQRS